MEHGSRFQVGDTHAEAVATRLEDHLGCSLTLSRAPPAETSGRQRPAEVDRHLREDGFTGPQVVLLSMRSDANAVAGSLHEPPWKDRLEPLVDEKTHSGRLDGRSGKLRYGSIHRFKGLEARAVVLTDIEKVVPKNRALLYVGATRAKQRLIVLAHDSLRVTLR